MTTQTNEQTKAKLIAVLKDCGLTEAKHKKAVTAYNGLTSDASVKAVLSKVDTIGSMVIIIKEHHKANKINLNSGSFGGYCKTYFPRLRSEQFSIYSWYAENKAELDKWNTFQKVPSCNPEVIRRNLRKELKADSKATKDTYKNFGLKPPTTKVKSTTAKETTPAVKDGDKTLTKKAIDNMPTSETLGWIEALTNNLKTRSSKNGKSFSGDDLKQIERVELLLADIVINATMDSVDTPKNVQALSSASK